MSLLSLLRTHAQKRPAAAAVDVAGADAAEYFDSAAADGTAAVAICTLVRTPVRADAVDAAVDAAAVAVSDAVATVAPAGRPFRRPPPVRCDAR